MNLLIVDDYPEAADVLQELLKMDGHTVKCCYSMQEAKAALAAAVFDGALIDLMLGDGSGFELARAIRAGSSGRMLLIAVSGHPRTQQSIGAFDHYVEKPIDFESLTGLLKMHAG